MAIKIVMVTSFWEEVGGHLNPSDPNACACNFSWRSNSPDTRPAYIMYIVNAYQAGDKTRGAKDLI